MASRGPINKFKFGSAFKFDISVALNKYDINLFFKECEDVVEEAMVETQKYIKEHAYDLIIANMIYGSRGWFSIRDTAMWEWITSPKGLGQLGLANAFLPITQLLKTYEIAWDVQITKEGFDILFGDIKMIRKATIHPSAGRGRMPKNRSWYDWLYISEHFVASEPAKFIKTGPKKGIRSSRTAGPEAGRMAYKKGTWRVPAKYLFNPQVLANKNRAKIASVIRTVFYEKLEAKFK